MPHIGIKGIIMSNWTRTYWDKKFRLTKKISPNKNLKINKYNKLYHLLSPSRSGNRTWASHRLYSLDNPSDLTQRSWISWCPALGFWVALSEFGDYDYDYDYQEFYSTRCTCHVSEAEHGSCVVSGKVRRERRLKTFALFLLAHFYSAVNSVPGQLVNMIF